MHGQQNIKKMCNFIPKKIEKLVLLVGFIIRSYRRADKFLARPGRKEARKHVRDVQDSNNIEMLGVIKFFFIFCARQGAEENSRHSERNINLFPSWSC